MPSSNNLNSDRRFKEAALLAGRRIDHWRDSVPEARGVQHEHVAAMRRRIVRNQRSVQVRCDCCLGIELK